MDPEHLSTSQDVPAGGGSGPPAVPLADVLAREIPLHWYESVAVVAGLCATLADQHLAGAPQPEAVWLTREGQVTVGKRPRLLPAAALPRILQALLATGTTPPPLRAFVLQAIAPDSTISMAAFAASLEYYERPGRAGLVQAVYQRVIETPADHTTDAPRQFVLEAPAQTPAAVAPPRRSRSWVAAATLLVCAACAVMYGIAASPRSAVPATQVGETPAERPVLPAIVDRIGEAARAVGNVVREQVAAVIATPRAAPPPPQPEAAPAPARVRRRAAGPRRVAAAPAPPPHVESVPGPLVDAVVEEPAPAAADSELVAFPFAAADGRIIYSTGALDVTPPILRDPHRLPGSLQVAGESASNAMELVISETGAVERVLMVGPSTHLTDMMLLGAAKTWKFDPATREGVAVKYRLHLDWAPGEH